MRRFILLILLALLPSFATDAFAVRTYYIDWVAGSDSNNGTAKGTPWKHAPGMTGASGNAGLYNGQAGDNIILKGGVTWPNAALGWEWDWSGTSTTASPGCTGTGCIYIGVDQTWFTGASWTRPILNGGGTAVATTGIPNTFFRLYANYVIFDNVEMTGLFWTGSPTFGTSVYFAFGGGTPGVGTNDEVEHLYIHGWTHGTNASGTHSNPNGIVGDTSNPNNNANTIAHDNVIDGSDTDHKSGDGFFGSPPYIVHNFVQWAEDCAVIDGTILFDGNTCLNIPQSFDQLPTASHTNGLEINLTSQNAVISNNVIAHLGSGTLGIWCAPKTGFTCTLYNNILYDTDVNNVVDLAQPDDGANTGSFVLYNNTIECGPDSNPTVAACIDNLQNAIGSPGFTFKNNHFINNTTSPHNGIWNTSGATFPVETTDLAQTKAAANGQGYNSAQTYPFYPTTGGATVGTGTNLTASCTGVLAGLCNDSSVGVSYNSTNHTVSSPNRTPVARPTSGAWDIGAYEFDSVAPVAGNSGTITTASVAATTLTLNWTKGTDTISPQNTLQYEVCQSLSNNVTTVGACEAATIIQAFSTDINTFAVTGLTSSTTYFFNIVIKDQAGNKTPYTPKSQTTASGTNTYYVTKSGSNANSCVQAKTVGTAKLTVAAGLACMSASDTLIIGDGTYVELIINTIPSGSMGANTIVQALNRRQTILRPTTNAGGNTIIQLTASSYITIDGIVADGAGLTTEAGGYWIQPGSSNITLQNGTAQNCGPTSMTDASGIEIGGSNNQVLDMISTNNGNVGTNQTHGIYVGGASNLISGNISHDNLGGYGIQVYNGSGGANSNTVINNLVYNNSGHGVILSSGTGNLFYNNIVYTNGSGIEVSGTNTFLYNNTIYSNSNTGIINYAFGAPTGAIVKNNIAYLNTNGDISVTATQSNNLTTNPTFVNAGGGDFHLTLGSSAIDSGATIGAVTSDINGTPRPQGSFYDIGAYEYIPDSTPPTPGNSGTITTASVSYLTLTLNWTKGTDNVSPQSAELYEVCQATTNSVSAVNTCEAATIIKAFTTDIATFSVTGLMPNTSYWFNVVIKDAAGNKAIYTAVNQTTLADTTAPVAGNSGTITTASVTSTTFTINFTKATDNVSAQSALQYEGCYATGSNTVTTIAGCEAATVFQAFTTDIATMALSGLTSGVTYYVNVVVKDEAGNKAVYSSVTQATVGSGSPSTITVTSGDAQTASLTSAFPTSLAATVRDVSSNPINAATVTFTAPSTGASGKFANNSNVTTAATNAAGLATASVFTSNAIAGSYTVSATVSGVGTPANFNLTNLACYTSSNAWQSQGFSAQGGTFTAAFDLTSSNSVSDAVIGISNGVAAAYTDLAAIVRFNDASHIDVMNSTAYHNDTDLTYTGGTSYHVRMVINIVTHLYSVYITPAGGVETLIATNYTFRQPQISVTSLAYFSSFTSAGTASLCNEAISISSGGFSGRFRLRR